MRLLKQKSIKLIFSITSLMMVFAVLFNVGAVDYFTQSSKSDQIPYNSYTYWTEYNTSEKTPAYAKPVYKLNKVINKNELGITGDAKLQDIVTDTNGNSYILDSTNSKVYVLDKEYNLLKVIENLTYNNEAITFVDAKGIYIDKNFKIYIADTENQRVIVLNQDGVVLNNLLLPNSGKIPTGFKYRPIKVAVDSKNYTYIASDGSYYGAIVYSPEMEFLGFFGANTVKATAADIAKNLYDRFFSNDVKRAADEISLPFTFTDIVVGNDDFVYTATGKSGKDDIQHGQICKFNPGGKDILNGSSINFADSTIGSLLRESQVQDLSCIDVNDEGYFYTLDTTYGRIFLYDRDCNLLNVFGGSMGDGFQKGTFMLASGLSLNGSDVLVSDSQANSITIFSITSYGKKLMALQTKTLDGDLTDGVKEWKEIINVDSNSQIAYKGIAKSYLEDKDYKNAIKYSKLGVDRETYAKAFEKMRTEKIEDNFALIVFGIIIVIALIVWLAMLKKKKNLVIFKNKKLKVALSSMAHPAESFRLVKEKNLGSFTIATVILILFYVITVINDTKGGFAFTIFDSSSYNAFYVLLSTAGLIILFTISNWLVCTLAGGIGTLKEIYVVSNYCLIPILLCRLLNLVLTHILVPSEAAFLGVLGTVGVIYAAFMLIIGIMRIQDYEFGRFVGTTIFTIIGMMIILFLLFLVFLLSQQVFGWIQTIIIEIKYR